MKSQKGVTLTSLAIYIMLVLIIVGILAVITGAFRSNIKGIYQEGTNNAEIDKFNIYFLKEVKKQGNGIKAISENEIEFKLGDKYTFKEDNCIYLNDNIKIAEDIEICTFSSKIENGKTVIIVTIKAKKAQEKVIEYVLSSDVIEDSLDNESDYTNYIPDDWDRAKLNSDTPIHLEVINNTIHIAPIPKGYEVSTEEDEDTISGGLVITDGENEFVWIPVTTDFTATYRYGVAFLEPAELTANELELNEERKRDSQENLDYYYGKDYYNFSEDFQYEIHYNEMVESVNKYNGFYMGRYETTIDEQGNIGSKENTTVLTVGMVLKDGTNSISNNPYYYRWWGLYETQRKANVKGNKEYIQTNMIWGQQWDAMLAFIGEGQANSTIIGTQSKLLKSGEAIYDNALKDKINNIYDLRRNALECTGEAISDFDRIIRGR